MEIVFFITHNSVKGITLKIACIKKNNIASTSSWVWVLIQFLSFRSVGDISWAPTKSLLIKIGTMILGRSLPNIEV